ncbi:MAG: rRNA maturation RNase YbeY [Cyanobacteria bacterium P01_H01_bin.15]
MTAQPLLTVNIRTDGEDPKITDAEWTRWLQGWLLESRDSLPPGRAYELTLRLTSEEVVHSLNAQYRGLDRPTDVLAFAALESGFPLPPDEDLYLGDIVIAIAVAQRQAEAWGHALEQELVWLAAHGFLHLLGWDHPDEVALNAMLTEQERLLKSVAIMPGKPLR